MLKNLNNNNCEFRTPSKLDCLGMDIILEIILIGKLFIKVTCKINTFEIKQILNKELRKRYDFNIFAYFTLL